MKPSCAPARVSVFALVAVVSFVPSVGCGSKETPLLPRSQTWAELRVIRRDVKVAMPVKTEGERAPYPRERLVDGERVEVAAGGLAWIRRDGGATLLVKGPAAITMRAAAVEIDEGRVFVDTPPGVTVEIKTPNGPLHLAEVRASVDVSASKKDTEAYVLAGEVRADVADRKSGEARAGAGELLTVTGAAGAGKAVSSPVVTWEDWTGGLATTDRAAEPSPFGVGTVGARRPGDQGSPRFPLAIQKLDVKVTVEQDFAITEVDELFFNPSSEVVEGVYRFRTPDGATLARFGVDREGVVVWGRVKEKAAAAAQYQQNVYQGSTEDPALLEWDAPGVYRARLYPIGPGETRRVVVRYAEWLGRTGAKGERRLYVYPMAAEGLESSLPHIEELTASIDLAKANAADVRCGMAGVRESERLIVRAHDLVPRADLAVELFDDGEARAAGGALRGYVAPHVPDLETLPPDQRGEAEKAAKSEADYVIVPVRSTDVPLPQGGLDLAIVVDTSAATDKTALSVARAATAALLAHLGKDDRVIVWAGDSSLRPIVPGKERLEAVDEGARRAILTGLASVERGGATDLGAMLEEAAKALDPARRGAVVYIGDGSPTVGELNLTDLRDHMAKLPRPVRVFGLGVGDGADMAILKGLSRGAFAERIGDSNAAARASLRLLEAAEHPAWLGATIDLAGVERVFPRDVGAMVDGETALMIGRVSGALPTSITVKGPAGEKKLALNVTKIDDKGDLRRRWAEGRLAQMIDEGTGRAAMVDLGSRHGIITPVTSLYVPTKNEMTEGERVELEKAKVEIQREIAKQLKKRENGNEDRTDDAEHEQAESDGNAGNKEGGSGTRAKGEEGTMGKPTSRPSQDPQAQAARGGKDAFRSAAPVAVAAATPAPSAMATASAPGSPPPPVVAKPPEERNRRMEALEKNDSTVATTESNAPKAAPDTTPASPATRAPGPAKEAATKGNTWGGEIDDKKVATLDEIPRDGDFGARIADPMQPPMDGSGAIALPLDGRFQDADQPSFNGPVGGVAGLVLGGDLLGVGQGGGGRGEGQGLAVFQQNAHSVAPARPVAAGNHAINGKLAEAKSPISNGWISTQVTVKIDDVPHAARLCGAAAFVPLEERVQLWRERLGRATGNPSAVATVYRQALAWCEAPTWRERSRLMSLCLDALPSVGGRVGLWRVMFHDLGAADALYRGILARVKTPAEMRELHDALGLRSIDPQLLEKTIKDAKTPEERVKKLRELVAVWPDDFALALRLLDMLEDVTDDAGARQLGRTLRARPDADARVRTAVGELYLRLSARAASSAQKSADEAEARRAFGEIVEFAPDDPVARRRLGDLLRAHGWFADAARQYETLAKLAPDDASVSLLLAAAAEGRGLLEEAVKWTEKGGAAGAPDAEQSPARTARALAATYLAWGKLAAQEGGRKDEAIALDARLARVLSTERVSGSPEASKGTRVSLTWSHPEFHPTLWSNALGSMMPAAEGDVTMGVAQVRLPAKASAAIEVRLEADEVEHAARLGATAILTAIFDEGTADQKIVKVPIQFTRGGPATMKLTVAGGEVKS